MLQAPCLPPVLVPSICFCTMRCREATIPLQMITCLFISLGRSLITHTMPGFWNPDHCFWNLETFPLNFGLAQLPQKIRIKLRKMILPQNIFWGFLNVIIFDNKVIPWGSKWELNDLHLRLSHPCRMELELQLPLPVAGLAQEGLLASWIPPSSHANCVTFTFSCFISQDLRKRVWKHGNLMFCHIQAVKRASAYSC